MLYMGSKLAKLYLQSLKNTDLCKSSASGVITIIDVVLTDLLCITRESAEWAWVHEAYTRIKQFAEVKQVADGLFKDGSYAESIRFYSEALKVPSVHR